MTTVGAASRGRSLLKLGRELVVRRPVVLLLLLLPLFLAVPFVGPAISPTLYGDEAGYLRLAHNLVHGSFLTGRDDEVTGGNQYPNLWFGPGFPLVLAPFVALGLPVSLVRLVGPLFLFLSVVMFFELLRLYVSQRTALVGAFAFGLYLPFYTVLEHLHSETLAMFLTVTMLYGTARFVREGARRYLVVAGVALGGLALTRVAFGWIVAALLVVALLWWVVRRDEAPRRFAAVCALALTVCVPWLAYTYSVVGKPFYWGSSGGLSLYWMSSPYPGERGDWRQAREVFADRELAPHRAFFRSLIGRPLVEQDEALVRASLENIRARPGRYAENVLANVSRMFFDFPYGFRKERLAPLLFVIPNALLLTALLVSLALLVGRWRLLPVEAIPFGLFALTAFIFHALLAAYPRMFFPVVPVVMWLVLIVMTRFVRLVPRVDGE